MWQLDSSLSKLGRTHLVYSIEATDMQIILHVKDDVAASAGTIRHVCQCQLCELVWVKVASIHTLTEQLKAIFRCPKGPFYHPVLGLRHQVPNQQIFRTGSGSCSGVLREDTKPR
jgi:hypothetical protein